MANLTEKIEIESFEKFQDEILAEDTTGRQHIISMPAFERWLLISGGLEWVLDVSEAGEHVQSAGTMTMEEYWYFHETFHRIDIGKYLAYKEDKSNKNLNPLKLSA